MKALFKYILYSTFFLIMLTITTSRTPFAVIKSEKSNFSTVVGSGLWKTCCVGATVGATVVVGLSNIS